MQSIDFVCDRLITFRIDRLIMVTIDWLCLISIDWFCIWSIDYVYDRLIIFTINWLWLRSIDWLCLRSINWLCLRSIDYIYDQLIIFTINWLYLRSIDYVYDRSIQYRGKRRPAISPTTPPCPGETRGPASSTWRTETSWLPYWVCLVSPTFPVSVDNFFNFLLSLSSLQLCFSGVLCHNRGVQVGSEGSVPANDGKSNGRHVSCSKPSLHRHKAPLGAGAV